MIVQLLSLLQQKCIIAPSLSKQNSMVVKHFGFWIIERTIVNGNTARTYSVENLFCHIACHGNILRTDKKPVKFQEFRLVVMKPFL